MFFWQFLSDMVSVKELKLAVYRLEDIAVNLPPETTECMRPALNALERLELEGVHRPKGKTAAVAIVNLLWTSPVLRHLRINLTTTKGDSHKNSHCVREFLGRKSRDDLSGSISHFLGR